MVTEEEREEREKIALERERLALEKEQSEKEERDRREAEKREKERQKQQAEFYSNLISRTKSGTFWVILILLIFGIALTWWLGIWKTALAVVTQVIIAILFIALIIWGFRDENENSKYIAIAFIIWGIDLLPQLPYLGPPYAGFNFDIVGFINANWIAIILSSIFIPALFFGAIRDFFKRNYAAVGISIILLWFIKSFFKEYSIFGYSWQSSMGNYIVLGVITLMFVLAFVFRDHLGDNLTDYLTYLFMILVASFFWINDFWMGILRAWLHVLFILYFGFTYMRSKEPNPSIWHLLIPAFLVADFFLYNLLWLGSGYDYYQLLKFVPILVILVLWYCIAKTPENQYATMSIFFILLIVLISVIPTYAVPSQSVFFEPKKGESYKDFFKQFGGQIRDVIESRLEFATGGYYRGSVEKNRYESLGVYFSNIRAADPRFYTDEPITVWGSIQSKTYKDAVIINFSCYRLKDNKRIRADKIIPNIKFPIFSLEDVDTECTFLPKAKDDPLAIQAGSNTITFSAEYNFGTDAYLKTYFIDRDRFRAYAREGFAREEDILKELGIKDTKPGAVFTNGPVEIGIGAGALVTVSEGYTIKPSIGITLTNRKEIQDKDKRIITRWEGKIKNITELVLLVPPGITLPNIESCSKPRNTPEGLNCPCSMPFKLYKTDDCKKTCETDVFDTCAEACKGVYKPSDSESEKNKENRVNCVKECETTAVNCMNECDFLFKPDSEDEKGQYTGYALDVGSLEFRDLNKDIDKHRSFSCRFGPSQSVLDQTPITTRYFRVRARYNYLIENSVIVPVEALPVEVVSRVPDDITKALADIKPGHPLWFEGLSMDLISAISLRESGWKHCCQESGNNKAGTCKPSDELRCGDDKILTSYTPPPKPPSIGMMQINKINEGIAASVCKSGQSIYDKECNILVGIKILKDNYNKYYLNGINPSTLAKFCPQSLYPDRYQKYLRYRRKEAALRAYNGWGCRPESDCQKACANSKTPTTCVSNCVDGTINYVEKILSTADKIKNGDIIDKSGIRSILASEDVQSIHEEETTSSVQTNTLVNAEATYDSSRRIVVIRWAKSDNPKTTKYLITRYYHGNSEDSFENTQNFYHDSNIKAGLEYSYLIYAIDNDYNVYGSAETNKVIIPITHQTTTA